MESDRVDEDGCGREVDDLCLWGIRVEPGAEYRKVDLIVHWVRVVYSGYWTCIVYR